jgi:hypothetical protein
MVKQLEYTPGRRSLQEAYFGICGILLLSEAAIYKLARCSDVCADYGLCGSALTCYRA